MNSSPGIKVAGEIVSARGAAQALPHSGLFRAWNLAFLSREEIASRVLFFGMILGVLIISAICIVNAIKWLDKPFAGFLVNERMVLGNVGQFHWTGTQAGLKFPDKIVKANGKTISSMRDLEEVIENRGIGDPIRYYVDRGGKITELTVPTMRFTWADLIMTFGIPLVSGIIYLLIGAVVFVLKPDTKVSWAFLFACFFLSLFAITSFDIQSTHWGLIKPYLFVNTFFPAAFIHLSLIFPEKWRFIERHPYLQLLPYAFSAILITPILFLYPQPSFMGVYRWVRLYTILSAGFMMASTLRTYFKKSSVLARQRAKVMLFGAALAFPIPALAHYASLFGGTSLSVTIQNNFLAIPIIVFPASIAYAIGKHNLFDVDVYIKRAVGYGVMTAIVGLTYFSMQLVMEKALSSVMFGESGKQIYPILFALFVVFFFNPMNRRVQEGVDKLFFRKRFDYKETISAVTDALTSVLNLDEIVKQVVHTIRKEMFIDTAGLMVLDSPKKACQTFFITDGPEKGKDSLKDVQIGYDDPLVALLSQEKKLITRYDIEEDPRYGDIKDPCGESFAKMGASIALPLLYRDGVTGILALGNKKSGHFYTRDDIDLLTTMASGSAIALENARLFQENVEKARMEEELKIAHDIQMSMLPDRAPAIVGLKIAARSIPAREVGGDFYDFIEIRGDGRTDNLGIVIGDVSGKGVSAALLMAASRSIYRVLAEAHPTVEEIMSIANARLNRDIKKGMFVALLYAVLDPMEKTLTVSNAGQTQPILCPGDASNPFYIDTEGDKFPLGIVKDCQYQGTCVQLKEGDIVVFYTDGVVEAINDKEELYGFDRFMASISERRELDADALLEKLIEHVQHYVGNVEQHDDITLVVVRVER